MPRLSELLKGIADAEIKGADPEITGLAYDSRRVKSGYLFICLLGQREDGHDYVADALARGASAILATKTLDVGSASLVCCADTLSAMAVVAGEFYGWPASKLAMYGITGTNGKTTCSYLLWSICQAAGLKTGLIGTLQYSWGQTVLRASVTTPLSLDLQEILAEMVKDDVKAVVIEVSSHALSLNRIRPEDFRAAAFTNLTQDHLDFHGDMESYLESKLELFRGLAASALAVYNHDDENACRVAVEAPCRTVSFGLTEQADYHPVQYRVDTDGIRLKIKLPGEEQEQEIVSSLLGEYNLANILCAVSLAHGSGLAAAAVCRGVTELVGVPGRLERISMGRDFTVVVDYAHTPDALERLLIACRQLAAGKLIVVFGCGGDRDRGKRPLMGTAACRQADLVVVTSDNPRSEDAAAIIREIIAGGDSDKIVVAEDRRQAISLALARATKEDLVVVAGKGHEDYQLIGDKRLPFDDRVVVKELLAEMKQ